MAPIAKEPEVLNSSAPASPASTLQPKPQPVALEVPVTVNGARTVDGSDKREPFSETTQTVLVFANGAVIRLGSTVAPGQLLFLTNEKTKKEVVCQVVKSKNYRSVSGYVELEFTEAVIGFWGMRFPGDRLGPATPPSAVPAASALSASASPANSTGTNAVPKAPETRPALTPTQSVAVPSVSSLPEVNQVLAAPVNVASILEAPAAAPKKPVTHLVAMTETPVPAAADDSTEALRKEAARLQEQLSAMLFAEAPAAKPVAPVQQPVPHVDAKSISAATSKIFELTKAEATASLPKIEQATRPIEPLKVTPIAPKPSAPSSADEEQVKIPSWLEPLARNATAPMTPPVAVTPDTSEAQVAGESYDFENQEAHGSAASSEAEAPNFGTRLLDDEKSTASAEKSSGGKTGLLIGAIAAGLLLAAGGGWWFARQSASKSVNAASAASQPATSPNAEQGTQFLASTSQPNTANKNFSNPAPVNAPASNSVAPTTTPVVEVQKIPSSRESAKQNVGNSSTSAASRASEPVEQTKKRALGSVHLAAPTVKGGKAGNTGEGEPGFAMEGGSAMSAESLNGGLAASHGKQPSAPVPVGGEVKPARLISSVQPLYPQLARSQRLAGDVRIDALIDENGRVNAMKVVSGPVLLHQAAMDSLHQWKYQPASLDGKPVPMHLTVTIQFRLQ